MAAPRGDTMEPARGSAMAVRPAIKTGEVVINGETETCKMRHEVTEREKVNGVTETCTARHVETTEIIETREMGTIGKRLHGTDGVGDAHTHAHTHTYR